MPSPTNTPQETPVFEVIKKNFTSVLEDQAHLISAIEQQVSRIQLSTTSERKVHGQVSDGLNDFTESLHAAHQVIRSNNDRLQEIKSLLGSLVGH